MEGKGTNDISFEEKYGEFLNELKSMPKGKGTGEEKQAKRKARMEYLRKFEQEHKEEYDNLIVDLMELYKPGTVRELKKRLGSGGQNENQMTDPDIISEKKSKSRGRELDYAVFMEAFIQSIEEYTGETQDGDEISFLQCVGMKYKQNAQVEYGKIAVRKGGIHLDTPENNQHYILRLVKKAKKIMEEKGEGRNLSDAIEAALQEIPRTTHRFTKAEITRAVHMVNGLDMMCDLDAPVTEDDGNSILLVDTLRDEKDSFESIEEDSFVNSCLQEMVRYFEEKWQNVKSAADKQSREWIKIFMSKDILILLKLYALSDTEKRKEYEKYIEPNCGQWCHRRKRCKIRKEKRTGCYIRYGKLIENAEAGDSEIYDILKSQEHFLYESVLKNDYIHFAFQDKIGSLYDIYSKQLKDFDTEDPEKRFQFTDAVIAKVQGENKDKVSKRRKRYETQTREELSKIFCELL